MSPAPRPPSPAARTNPSAVGSPPLLAEARKWLGKAQYSGQCLSWVSTVAGTKGRGQTVGTATQSWQQAERNGNLHTSPPPIGAPVYWSGGSTGAGHVAIVSKYVDGKPWVISTGVGGKVAEVPMSYFGNMPYKGWASAINNIPLDTNRMVAPTGRVTGPAATGGGSTGGDGTGPSGSTGPQGGVGSVSTGFSKKEFYADLSEKFGSIEVLLRLDKEAQEELGEGKSIKWAIDQMVKKKIVDPSIALTYLNQTAWFKKYSPEITKRLVEEESKPELTADNMKAVQASFEKTLNGMGIRVSAEDLQKVVRDAYVFGWTTDQMIDAVQAAGNLDFEGGTIAEEVDALRAFADEYGASLSDSDISMLRTELIDGMGTQSARDRIKEMAAQKYSVFADRIMAGESIKAITSPYWETAARLLETAPDSISWDDPLFRNGAAFMKVDEATGQQVVKTLNEFEADIRKDSRWLQTGNAKETIGNAQYDILRRFGFAA